MKPKRLDPPRRSRYDYILLYFPGILYLVTIMGMGGAVLLFILFCTDPMLQSARGGW